MSSSNLAKNGLSIISTSSNMLNNSTTKIPTFKEIINMIPQNELTDLKKTDDLLFAEHELKQIDKKVIKTKTEKLKIWEKSFKSDAGDMNIRKKLYEIRDAIKKTDSDKITENTNYFSKQHIEVISESSNIIKDRKLKTNQHMIEKDKTLITFVNDNKEISLKNFLLNLLQNERTSINNNELLVAQALKASEVKLDKDKRVFEEFAEKEKETKRNKIKRLEELEENNRQLALTKKKLQQEHKQIMDEIDRTVKIIINYKSNASFVHTVLEDYSIKFKMENFLDSKTDFVEFHSKEKDIVKLTESLIDEFSYLDEENMTLKKNLEDEFPRMISTFHQLEENILKLMTRKQDIDREIETEEEEYIQEIKQMHKREKKAKEERDKLLSEYELNEKITKELNKQAGEEGKNSELLSMLMDLYVNLIYGEDKKKIKKEINPIKELTESLQHIEFDIIQYIDKLEKLEKTNKNFKNEVVKRKDYNKIKNQESIKRKVEELQILRKKKAEERMHRKIIKGKRVMPHLLITKEDKKFDKNNIANKDNDDLYIINYNEDS